MFKSIKKTHEECCEDLMAIKNVQAVGIGKKITKGKMTNTNAIMVFVKNKKEMIGLFEDEVIPKKIGRHSTDVIEVGELEELSNKKKIRPVIGGTSAMYNKGSACTLGVVVFKNGRKYILGNQHCYFPEYRGVKKGTPIYQPSPIDGGTAKDEIAKASDVIPFGKLNIVDASLAELSVKGKEFEIYNIGKFSPYPAKIKAGEYVQKQGRTSGYTKAKVLATNVVATVNYRMKDGTKKVFTFGDQIFTEPKFIYGGDSSSLVLNMDKRPVGLVFAGSNKVGIFNRIQNVLDLLDCSFRNELEIKLIKQEMNLIKKVIYYLRELLRLK